MRSETEARERPRRPEDEWPAWVPVVLWLASLAMAGTVAVARAAGRGGTAAARWTAHAAGRARDAVVEGAPVLAQRISTSSGHIDRWAGATVRDASGVALRWVRSRQRGRIGRAARPVALVGVVLAAALWTFSAPALRLAANVVADDVTEEGLPALGQSSVVIGSNGETLTEMPGGPHRRQVSLDEVPDFLVRMVVAVEDDRFWEHEGWDGAGIVRAALANATSGEVEQGGSTISQQLAKQNYTDSERTVVRKAKELLYAVALEERYSKSELLERYLNEVYLGSGAYGVGAAAEEYFGVTLAELRKDQAALLAGLIPSPTALDPRRNPDGALNRRNMVLGIAAERGVLDPQEAERLQDVPVELAPSPARVTDPLLAAAVIRDLLAEPALGADRDQRAERIATGGLRIETSIDGRFQAAAVDAVHRGLERWPGLSGALAAVDPHTGEVRALASVTPPGLEGFDLATQGRRQPGSTFKPLAAVAALEAGIDPRRELEGDSPAEFEHQPGQRWTVENYAERDHGRVTMSEALTSSVNTAFAEIAIDVGTPAIVDVADRVGIDIDEAMGGPEQRGPSIALGALSRGVSPLEMASAYGFLATGGGHADAHIVTRVVVPDGRVLVERPGDPRPVVDPAVTGELRGMLQEVVDDGTGRAAAVEGWRPAGKTGTSQNNADAWFAGTIPTLSVATWLGHPDAAQPVSGLTGGSAAAPIWRDFVAAAVEGTDPVPFPDAPPYVPTEPSPLDRDAPAEDPDSTPPSTQAEAPVPDSGAEPDRRPGRGRGRGRP